MTRSIRSNRIRRKLSLKERAVRIHKMICRLAEDNLKPTGRELNVENLYAAQDAVADVAYSNS